MMKYSLSFTKGLGNIKHNKREHDATKDNVDPTRTHDNLIMIDEDIRQVYQQLFDSAADDYNSKQKRNDRKIKNYYQKINHSKKENLFQEIIIQLGDKENHPTDPQLVKRAFNTILRTFQDQNPQFHVFGAYVHLDEATPHLHLDYVPVAHYDKGMKLRVANNRAIEQMGYKDWNHWRETQINHIGYQLANYNSINLEKKNNHARHQSVAEFKEMQRRIDLDLKELNSNVFKSTDIDLLLKENQLLERQNKLYKENLEELGNDVYQLKKKSYVKENKLLQKELINQKTITDEIIKKSKQLQKENQKLKDEIVVYNDFFRVMKTVFDRLHLSDIFKQIIKLIKLDEKSDSKLEKISEEVERIVVDQVIEEYESDEYQK